MNGTLYGLGVGPGDPELITLKSWRILSMAEVVAYPVAPSGTTRARDVASHFIPEDVIELPLEIPFGGDEAETAPAYDAAADSIATHLDAGRNVAFLCMGDPLFHGSFSYLMDRLADRHSVEVVPGVAAPMSCAAALRRPLARRAAILKVLPATADAERLRREIAAGPATLVFIKAGRHVPALRRLLEDAGLLDSACVVEDAGSERQRLLPLREAEEASPYFSTIIVFAGEAA